MKTRSFVIIALAAVIAANAAAVANARPGSANIGQPVADFKLPDAEGKEHSLSALKGEKGTIIIFISARCPMVRAYNERIAKLALDYRARGVNVVGINSNVTESADDIKRHAAENNFSFVVLRDKSNKVADLLGAERTPEVFLLDASNKLVYRGRIDNHKDVSLVQSNDLRDAIDETLAGKPVTKAEAAAFGCTIKRG